MVQRLTWLVPLVLLQGCAGTPLAERFERSFGAADASSSLAPETAVEKPAARSEDANRTGPTIKDSAGSPVDRPEADKAKVSATTVAPVTSTESLTNPKLSNPKLSNPAASKPTSSNQPQEPYRITIRLSGVDPAAPAEAVTRVLRNADVNFAVERIERIQP